MKIEDLRELVREHDELVADRNRWKQCANAYAAIVTRHCEHHGLKELSVPSDERTAALHGMAGDGACVLVYGASDLMPMLNGRFLGE